MAKFAFLDTETGTGIVVEAESIEEATEKFESMKKARVLKWDEYVKPDGPEAA